MKDSKGSKCMSMFATAGIFTNTITLIMKSRWESMPEYMSWAGGILGTGLILIGIYRRRDVLLGMKK